MRGADVFLTKAAAVRILMREEYHNMKFFGNVTNGAKLMKSVHVFNKRIKDIEAAKARGDYEEERRIIAEATGIWVNNVIKLLDMHINIKGRENIPEGPCVFFSNHQGYADIPTFFKACEGKQIGFIAKDSLAKAPYFGKWIRNIRGIFITRGDTRESLKSFRTGVDYLKDGFSLVIFPEGTRSQGGPMREFKAGSFKLATKAKVPVVPVTINGSYHLVEETGIITKGVHIDIVIHPAIPTAGMERSEMVKLHETVEATVRTTLEELQKHDDQPDLRPDKRAGSSK